jgi:predicted ATPase
MTGGEQSLIRTPDQRIRVFVSSTLRELAEERAAVRTAIEHMRLAPVMFELGARPHPPRELYRSYLAQSDVFVGIYADSYGWVAPGEDISGLEDEYNLAPTDVPKLIYIKRSDHREERLKELIGRIQRDDTAAYLPFETADELADRVVGDLATLLAERFDESKPGDASEDAGPSASLVTRIPAAYTTTIGRERDLAQVRQLLEQGEHRVVTLIGPGGVGKSRLAIEVAHATEDLYPDGTFFVLLEGVLEEGLLLPTIAYFLGIRDNGEAGLEERISHALDGRRVLIVLDNFEQIVGSAPLLVRLYTVAPTATFLVTSRIVLRIRGEQVYEVEALPPPAESGPVSVERARRSPAVQLFVDRAQAVKPEFTLTSENAGAVADICRRLEGLPLAIELAAAKVRLLTPQGIAERLEHSLPLLTASVRDLPDRHRTMRATIDWSVGLLPPEQRALLEDLGVFATRFTLEAVESIGRGRMWDGLGLDALSELVDASLVTQAEIGGRPTFSLLAIMREYAIGRLKERGEADAMRVAHADYYVALVHRIAPDLRGPGQPEAVRLLGLELPNLRAAARHLVYTNRLDDAGDFAWRLLVYWWISGFFSEVRLWMLELLDKQQPITKHTRAAAGFFTMWGEMWRHPSEEVVSGLGESERLFTESGDEDAAAMALAARATTRLQFPDLDADKAEAELNEAVAKLRALGDGWAESMAEVGLGFLAVVRGQIEEALAHFSRSAEVADQGQNMHTRIVAGNNRTRVLFMLGQVEPAEQEWLLTLSLSARLHYVEGAAYALEGLAAVAALRGEGWRAGALSAAAATTRQSTGIFDIAGFAVHVAPLEALRERDPESVSAGEKAGAEMSIAEAIALALPDADADADVREALAQW